MLVAVVVVVVVVALVISCRWKWNMFVSLEALLVPDL